MALALAAFGCSIWGSLLPQGPPNIAIPTVPDSRWWTAPESLGAGEWRVQRHRIAGHWRLIDAANIRRAYGTRQQCEEAWHRQWESLDAAGREALMEMPEFNLPLPTLEGPQFWVDCRVREGWRLQRHARTGHWRLIAPGGIRRGWGGRPAMMAEWERLVVPRLGPPPPRVVIYLHGILRSKECWWWMVPKMERAAREAGQTVEMVAINYPSTQVLNEESARALREVLEGYPPETRFDLVGHSMGGLVAMLYLNGRTTPLSEAPHAIDSLITMGTPYGGASRADLMQHFWLYRILFGPAGQQLRMEPRLLAPDAWPKGITVVAIAGSRPPGGFSATIPGDDDGTVELESALPEQATYKYTVRRMHSFIMYAGEVERLVAGHLFGREREGHPKPEALPDATE